VTFWHINWPFGFVHGVLCQITSGNLDFFAEKMKKKHPATLIFLRKKITSGNLDFCPEKITSGNPDFFAKKRIFKNQKRQTVWALLGVP
jgi:hypothetical protein